MELIGNLILPDKILHGAKLVCEDGVISQIIPGAAAPDADLPYIAPGYIDIHNHGGGDWLFAQDPMYCAEFFLKHGQTTILPTFYHNLDMKTMLEGAEKVRKISKTGAGRA